MARRVLMAKVSGGRVQGRPRLGWMDGVKVALGNRDDDGGCATMRERSERVQSPELVRQPLPGLLRLELPA